MPEAPAGPEPATARPVAVTVVCVLAMLALAATLLSVVGRWSTFQTLPASRQLVTVVAMAALAATLLAYWRMRRWGVWLLAIALLARVAAGAAGLLPMRMADVVLPLVLLAAGALAFRRMR